LLIIFIFFVGHGYISVIPATQEVEARLWFEASLDKVSETLSQKQDKNKSAEGTIQLVACQV
jgi:hypothetical protein